MDHIPDIINTDIISSRTDAFFNGQSDRLDRLEPRPVLVLSRPFTPGSAEDVLVRKMLQGCKLEEEQYHLLQLDEEDTLAWHQLRERLGARAIILLGVTPDQLGIAVQFMPHQVSRFNDCSWIPTASPEQLIQYPDIKGHLWNYGLKPVFVDKVYG